jgi:RNA polymerase sigma-70 factor, ECF subfamily
MPPPQEQLILQKVTAGDRGALGQLLELYQHRVYNVCLRMVGNRDDAAEVAQDAMLKVVEHIGDYNGQCAISTWMIRIAMNLSISHLRRRRLRLTTSLDAGGAGSDDADQSTPLREQIGDPREPGPESGVQHNEMIAHLHKALRQLDEEFRSVLVLRDVEEMDYQQIAEILALPVGTVKSRLFRARLALRQKMCALYPSLRQAAGGGASL